MRQILTASVSIALVFGFGSAAEAQDIDLTVDQVVARFVEACGGLEAMREIGNLVYTGGTYREGDFSSDGSATMSLGRPFYKLVGDKNSPGGYMEGYDGAAWEWYGDPGIVVRTVGEPSEAIRHYAGVEHPLVDYRARGSEASLEGEVTFDQAHAVVVKLTRRDGFVERFYVDTESWLIIASGFEAPLHAFGDDIQTLTRIGDYRDVAGVLIPHRFESVEMPEGDVQYSMEWGRIEANRDLPDDWFSPPTYTRSPVQAFIEHLYGQRHDMQSVIWTYEEFRVAYPDVETASAVNVAGFQMLKTGATEQAIALLERNAKDNPDFADSRFRLGQAYRSAGRDHDARTEFEAALRVDPAHERASSALEEIREATRDPVPLHVQSFDGLSLAGDLYLPAGSGPFPAVIIAHGAERGGRAQQGYIRWANNIRARGIAVLVFDKRGVGESAGEYVEAPDLSVPAADILAWHELLKSREELLADRIGVLGWSQGGWTGPLAASQSDLAFVVMISGPTMSPLEQNIFDKAEDVVAAAPDAESASAAERAVRLVTTYLVKGTGREEAREAWEAVASEPWFSGSFRGIPFMDRDALLSDPRGAAYVVHSDYEPLPVLQSLAVPVLAVYGSADQVVPVEPSIEILRQAIEGGEDALQIHVFPGADHGIGLRSADGTRRDPKGYPDLVLDWLEQVAP